MSIFSTNGYVHTAAHKFYIEKKVFLKSNAYSLLPLQQSLEKYTILAEVEPTPQNDTKCALSQQMFPCHVVSNTFRNEGFHIILLKQYIGKTKGSYL